MGWVICSIAKSFEAKLSGINFNQFRVSTQWISSDSIWKCLTKTRAHIAAREGREAGGTYLVENADEEGLSRLEGSFSALVIILPEGTALRLSFLFRWGEDGRPMDDAERLPAEPIAERFAIILTWIILTKLDQIFLLFKGGSMQSLRNMLMLLKFWSTSAYMHHVTCDCNSVRCWRYHVDVHCTRYSALQILVASRGHWQQRARNTKLCKMHAHAKINLQFLSFNSHPSGEICI